MAARVSFTVAGTRLFGRLADGAGCPGIGCGRTHFHAVDDAGYAHVVAPRNLTHEGE